MLGYRLCRVSGHISPGNLVRIEIIFIKVIGSGGSNADEFQILCSADGLFVDWYFIDDQNICIFDAFRGFFRGGKVVLGYFTEGVKSR